MKCSVWLVRLLGYFFVGCYMSDPCDNRYHASVSDGFPNQILERLSELPNKVKLNPGPHANFRQSKSKYLSTKDARDPQVEIKVPSKVNIRKESNLVFEVGTVEIGTFEALKRVCIRMKDKDVIVENANDDYSNYEYCLVLDIDPNNPMRQQVELTTVYLNDWRDNHEDTLQKVKYENY